MITENCLNCEELVEFPVIDERCTSIETDTYYALGVFSNGGTVTLYKNLKEGILLDRVVKFNLTDYATIERKREML